MNVLHPVGPRAGEIADLMLVFFGISAVVYLIVIAFLVFALMRRRPRGEATQNRSQLLVGAGMTVTVVILIGLTAADFIVWRALNVPAADPLRVRITGNQFWWDVEYQDPTPSNQLRTANELHIPVGRPVQLTLQSSDVIHSFWVPRITGKKDLIPGRTTTEILIADEPGVYTGQCAEFCGFQHAQMRLRVRALPGTEFEQWKQQQLAPAREPTTDQQRHGRDVFIRSSCSLCHTIQGTAAAASVGPDLTHIASRETLAAGTLPNNEASLAGWILNPQRIKPGTRMPATPLPPEDLLALVSYLSSLK
jgi:cytochrome c oxidase subunit 2